MNFDNYPMQILVVVAKGCRRNSPYPERYFMNLKPPDGLRVPQLGKARDALLRAGLIERSYPMTWVVRPTELGYQLYDQWRAYLRALKERPVLFDPVKPQMHILDQRRDRWAGTITLTSKEG